VRAICDTDVTDPEITIIISWVDEIIAMKINVGSFSAVFLEGLSATYAAYKCFLKDPNARRLGEYQESRDVALRLLKAEVDDMLISGASGVKVVATREELA